MRVNVSYSVELDQVPTAVANVVTQSLDDLKAIEFQLENTAKKLKNDPDISKALTKIDSLRRDMAKIDVALMESAKILAGYQQVVAEQYLAQEDGEEVPEEAPEKESEE